MSSEGKSRRTRKWNLSRASRDGSNERHNLWYQQNKVPINEHRRATYCRRTSEATIQNDFIIPRKYRTMDDIMERTFHVNSSLLGYAPPQHNLVVWCSSKNFHNIGKHLALGKNAISIMWMKMFTLTLLCVQLHVLMAKGCKTSMVEVMMTFCVMIWMIVY